MVISAWRSTTQNPLLASDLLVHTAVSNMSGKDTKKKSRKERQRELRMLEKEISGGKSLIDYGKVNQVRAMVPSIL